MTHVHFVVPEGIDDPARPSGGNVYDRRLADELPHRGWNVVELPVPGSWPSPSLADRVRFDALLADLPDESIVLIDGLIASAAETLVTTARRLRIVVLLHMPEATRRVEADVLNAAAGVITSSAWARRRVIDHYGLPSDRVWASAPGVDPAPPSTRTASGGNLLCVGPVTPAKGHDLLVAALADIADLNWTCTCAGALDLDLDFVDQLRQTADAAELGDRLTLAGPLSRTDLADVRSRADLLISASRRESYGMAVTEALASGIPVIATNVGGHREAVGQASDGTLPGALIPADDASSLAATLRSWLTDPDVRSRWRRSAELRSRDLPDWPETTRIVAEVLREISGSRDSTQPRF